MPWNIITPRKLSLTGLYELCSRPGFGSSKIPFAEVMLLFMWKQEGPLEYIFRFLSLIFLEVKNSLDFYFILRKKETRKY